VPLFCSAKTQLSVEFEAASRQIQHCPAKGGRSAGRNDELDPLPSSISGRLSGRAILLQQEFFRQSLSGLQLLLDMAAVSAHGYVLFKTASWMESDPLVSDSVYYSQSVPASRAPCSCQTNKRHKTHARDQETWQALIIHSADVNLRLQRGKDRDAQSSWL